jgi:putative heme-binding domain-containing protein
MRKTTSLLCAAALLIGSTALVARQQAPAAPDFAYPGSGLTRQQLMDKLTAADFVSKPDLAEGKATFTQMCAGCHIFGDLGASVGPDLSTVAGRFKKRDILDSILWPSKTISDQYTMITITLEDGTTESGMVTREDATTLYLKTAARLEGRGLPIPLAKIKDRKESTVSLMPEHLVASLKLEQVDNLVGFLLTGK